MIFLISKIISFIIDPIIWILILFIAGRLTRHRVWKRRCYIYATVVFFLFSNTWLLNNIWDRYQYQPVKMESLPHSSAGILLGGLSGYDETLKIGFFGPSSDRFIQTNRLFHQKKIDNIVLTGGNIKYLREQAYSEAAFLGENLLQSGVPRENIFLDEKAKNTLENAKNSKILLDKLQLKGPYILITSAVHMPRALKIFNKAGIAVVPYATNYLVTKDDTKFRFAYLFPSSLTLLNWSTLLREWMGLVQMKLVG